MDDLSIKCDVPAYSPAPSLPSLPSLPPLVPLVLPPPPLTGRLPADKPILARGDVYCGTDFRQRAVRWFAAEKARVAAATTTANTAITPSAATRIQPARAAKRKAEAVPAARAKRVRLPSRLASLAPLPDYTIDMDGDAAWLAPAAFGARLDAQLASRVPAVTCGCGWATPLWPPGQTARPGLLYCPVVARPLACTDMAFCAHGLRGAALCLLSCNTPCASPALMAASPPPSPPSPSRSSASRAALSLQTATARHVQERTVAVAGLRFALDGCNGMLRAWMV